MCEKSAADASRGKVLEALREAKSILVTAHERPDGDAIGSLTGLCRAARGAGKTVYPVLLDSIPENYKFLFDAQENSSAPQSANGAALTAYPKERFAELADAAELIVIVDTCSYSQLECIASELRTRADKIAVLDHHATFDLIGRAQWNDSSAAAAGVMVAEAIDALGWPMDASTAQSLVAAITTDTGWMRFSNTDGRCLRTVARLLEAGARLEKLYARLFQADRPARLKLMTRMLSSLELHCDNRLAVMCIRQIDMIETGARSDETENLINEALRIGSVEAVALLTEMPDCIRVSFRSRQVVNVAAVAGQFGGGGHARAAGVRLKEPLPAALARITAALQKELTPL